MQLRGNLKLSLVIILLRHRRGRPGVLSPAVIGLHSLQFSLLQLALQPVTPASAVLCQEQFQ